jgi:hypothetical protein
VEPDHGKLVMGRQLRSSATAVVVTFGGALAPRVAPAVAARAGARPSIESVWVVLVRQIDCASSAPMAARVLAKIRT